MKPTVYIETTIPSYLVARPSKDPVRVARQQATAAWWNRRERFELFVSRFVIEECGRGDPFEAAKRMDSLVGIPFAEESLAVEILAKGLLSGVPLPARAATDAIHLALAAVNRINYLVTWNCAHLANVLIRRRIESVCVRLGHQPPLIATPDEFPEPEAADA